MAENAVNPSVTEELTEEKLNEVLKIRRERIDRKLLKNSIMIRLIKNRQKTGDVFMRI